MAKKKFTTIGSILKGKEGKSDYIKISQDVTLKAGTFLNLESKASKLASVTKAVESGKMSQEMADKIKESVEKMPSFVRFNIVLPEEA